jgi:hypothetical protein
MNPQEHQLQANVRESLIRFCRVHKLYDGHLGPCKYCGKTVYWGRNRNGKSAPPFESFLIGAAQPGEWVHHRTRCPHFVGAIGRPIDPTPRLIKKKQ